MNYLASDQQTLLPADQCIEAIVIAGGNYNIAAERLFGIHPNNVACLVASIAQDPLANETLLNNLRTLTILKTFGMFTEATAIMGPVITDLEPKDFVKYVTDLTRMIADFTAPNSKANAPTSPEDAITKVMAALPPTARRALITLIAKAPAVEDEGVGPRSPLGLDEGGRVVYDDQAGASEAPSLTSEGEAA